MAQYEHLPIYKAAFDLLIYFETIVKGFSRYHKYTHGAALRDLARKALMLIIRANNSQEKGPVLEELRITLEELKVVIRICKEVKAFPNFNSFESSINQVIGLAKQNEGWARSVSARNGPRPESSTHVRHGTRQNS